MGFVILLLVFPVPFFLCSTLRPFTFIFRVLHRIFFHIVNVVILKKSPLPVGMRGVEDGIAVGAYIIYFAWGVWFGCNSGRGNRNMEFVILHFACI